MIYSQCTEKLNCGVYEHEGNSKQCKNCSRSHLEISAGDWSGEIYRCWWVWSDNKAEWVESRKDGPHTIYSHNGESQWNKWA